MNREQLNERIEHVCKDFRGAIPELYSMVGALIVGRLFGWRVVRLTVSRRTWTMMSKAFGDPKELMPERGPLAYKSVGLKLVDEWGDYWDFVRGSAPREGLSPHDRKAIVG